MGFVRFVRLYIRKLYESSYFNTLMRIKPRFKKRRTNRTNGICNFFAFFHSPTRIRASRCILPSLLRRVFPGRGALAPAAPDGEEPSNTPGICQSYDSDIFPLAVSAPVAWGRGAEKSGPLGRSRPQAGGAEPAARPERPTDRGPREGRTRAGPSWGDPPRLRRRRSGREPAVARRVGPGTTRSSPRATGGPSAGAVRAAHRA